MGFSIAEKIIKSHLVSGTMERGSEVALRIDQTLTQDATGTMAYLEFEKMNIPRVKTELSVAYVDHNTLQCGFENADDHRFIQSAAAKYGLVFSGAGNGICHQIHLERFSKPGKTLVGSDSHTPTCGAVGMLAMGAGGMDVAAAMGGGAYEITMPGILRVEVTGRLRPFVTAKDVALEALRLLTVKGGVGYIVEWGGEGVKTLSVPERATIANMGAELGATASVFPSDERTREFLAFQGREKDYVPLGPDGDAVYEKTIRIDLGTLEPLAACPHSPDRVVKVSELSAVKVDQVCIGSCTNSSLKDLFGVSAILRGRRVDPSVSLSVSPGSKQVLSMLSDSGAFRDLLSSGARILECACGPCIGMGLSPETKGISLRTFNRNFEGRSGTKSASVYLVSPETAAASALTGYVTDPRTIGSLPHYRFPERAVIDDSGLIPPADPEIAKTLTLRKGPNIGEIPAAGPLPEKLDLAVSLKVGDNITTDHIMPAGAAVLPYRSNIPKLSEFCFRVVDETFADRAKALGSSVIVGGANYGQGSSREHAALVPLYLGVRAVLAKSFARIHAANLVNAGILPLTFVNEADYEKFACGCRITLEKIREGIRNGRITAAAGDTGRTAELSAALTARQKEILLAGGLMAYTSMKSEEAR